MQISNNADNTDIEKLEGMLDLRMRGGGGIVDPMQVEHDASEVHGVIPFHVHQH